MARTQVRGDQLVPDTVSNLEIKNLSLVYDDIGNDLRSILIRNFNAQVNLSKGLLTQYQLSTTTSTYSGTVTVTSGTNTVSGTGTLFTRLSPGETINVGVQSRTINTITNDTSMTVTTNWATTATASAYTINRFRIYWPSTDIDTFIAMVVQKRTGDSTDGYFRINCPTSGTINRNHGVAETITAQGIPLGLGESLYYKLPWGSGNATVQNNFLIVHYLDTTIDLDKDYILIATINPFNRKIFLGNGQILKSVVKAYTSTNFTLTANAATLWKFQTEVTDYLDEYDPATYTFTSKAQQLVFVSANCNKTLAANRHHYLAVYKNGTIYCKGSINVVTTATNMPQFVSNYIPLNIGDTIQIYNVSQDGTNRTSVSGETESILNIISLG